MNATLMLEVGIPLFLHFSMKIAQFSAHLVLVNLIFNVNRSS